MSRHRSPSGRRAHLGPSLSLSVATAGAGGGALRSLPFPPLTSSLPVRFIATALAGGALAAVGQHALADSLPHAASGVNALRLGVEELVGAPSQVRAREANPVITYEAVAVAPVAPAPAGATAADLVKAANMQAAAAAATAAATAQAAAAAAIPHSAGGGVQMIVGQLSSGFGGRWGAIHEGLDIAAPIGTPIRVPLGGTVISSGPADGFGMWVRVQHAGWDDHGLRPHQPLVRAGRPAGRGR